MLESFGLSGCIAISENLAIGNIPYIELIAWIESVLMRLRFLFRIYEYALGKLLASVDVRKGTISRNEMRCGEL
jgi:hypothetical protein